MKISKNHENNQFLGDSQNALSGKKEAEEISNWHRVGKVNHPKKPVRAKRQKALSTGRSGGTFGEIPCDLVTRIIIYETLCACSHFGIAPSNLSKI